MLAEMTWEWTADRIDISIQRTDRTSIDLKAAVDDSAISRVWNSPNGTSRSLYIDACVIKTQKEGRSVTSKRLKCESSPKQRYAYDTLLGTIQPPERPITFGDVNAFDHPFIFVRDLLLEYPSNK